MLNQAIIATAQRSVLAWLATVDPNGQPNVAPKEVFAVHDPQHIVIANIASPTSVRNLAANPKACLSFIDIFIQKGYKLIGSAENLAASHPEFAYWAAPLQAITQDRFKIHSVIKLHVNAIETIIAPSYRFYPNQVTEQSQIDAAMQAYGVKTSTD